MVKNVLSKLVLLVFILISFSLYGCKEKGDLISMTYELQTSYDEDDSTEKQYLYIFLNSDGTSPATIDSSGKEITSGISMKPAIEGTWHWATDYTMYFKPMANFPPDTKYNIIFEPSLFNSSIAGKKVRTLEFISPRLNVDIISENISRRPTEPRTPRFTSAIMFSHKIDVEDIQKHSILTLEGSKIGYTLSFDNKTNILSIVSDPVVIKESEQKFLFEATGFTAIGSNLPFKEKIRASAVVPALSNFFKVNNIDASIIKDSKGEPEQLINIILSAEAFRQDIAKSIEVSLLPKYIIDGKPVDSTPQENVNRSIYHWNYEDLNKYDIKLQNIIIKPAPAEGLPETVHPFIVDIDDQSDRYVLVTNNANIISKDGFVLSNNIKTIVRIPAYPKELSIMSDGAILPLKNDNIITFASRGLKTINVEVGRVLKYQLQNVINTTYSGGLNSTVFTDNTDESNYTSLSNSKMNIKFNSPKDINYSYIDLKEYTKNEEAGLYYISLASDGKQVKRFVLVTDMGMILKTTSEKNSALFVMSISSGVPVNNAKVDIIGKNGLSVYSGYTNRDGYFTFPDLSSFTRDKYPIAVTATVGNDISFIPLNKYSRSVNYSNFDVGGTYLDNYTGGLNAFLFTERGLYRPGDKVYISGIVKQGDWQNLEGVAVEAVISDSNEKEMIVKRFTLNKEGFFEFIFDTKPTMITGRYHAELYMLKNNSTMSRSKVIGRTTFKLDEFEADTMRVHTRIAGKSLLGWQKPELVSGRVKAENMFGTPAQNRQITWGLEVVPARFSFNLYKDYNFTDPNMDSTGKVRKPFSKNIPNGVTDDNGEGVVDFGLETFSAGTYRIMLSNIVFESGSGDGVTGFDNALISPLDFIIGYKTTGNLSFINRNSDQNVNFIAIDNELNKISVSDLKTRLSSVKYIASLIQDNSGGYSYQSVKKSDIIMEDDFTVSAGSSNYKLVTENAGRYIIEIIDNQGRVLSSIPYFVSGEANISGGIDKNAELTVELNKKQYAPLEEMSINIIAPYTGTGLITIEQDKVYAYKWFKTNTTSSVQSITLPANLEGNGYINVSFIRGYDSKEIFINPHSYAVVPFSVNLDKHKVDLSLSAPDLVQPGDELKIKYSSNKDGKIILYGVDEGILQVANYSMPNPLGHFFAKRALSVQTYQTVDLILPDYRILMNAMAPGGGEMDALLARNNPFVRKTAKPIVFWSGIMDMKGGTDYEYIYKVPDYFNGNIKIMAVVAALNSVGGASISTVSRGQIILMPNAPFAAVAGDIFDVHVGVTNSITNSDDQENITVTAEVSDNLEIIGDKTVTVAVPADSERKVYFKVKVKDIPGNAEIVISGDNEKLAKPIKFSSTLSIRPATLYTTQIDTGNIKNDTYKFDNLFREMYDNLSLRKVSVSSNPLVAIGGAESYLDSYPHSCTEQITSRVFPLIYLSTLQNGELVSFDKVAEQLKILINTVRARQFDDGGFSLWSDRSYVSSYSSIYLLHMLTDAKDNGFTVPSDIVSKGLKWMSAFVAKEPMDLWTARVQAYGIYVLARNGVVVTRHISRLEEYLNAIYMKEWKSDITASYLGAAYILMKEKTKGISYLKGYKPEGVQYIFYNDYDSSSIRNANYLYLIGNHAPELLPDYRSLIEGIIKNFAEGNYNTIGASSFIISLGVIGQNVSTSDDNLSIISFDKDGNKEDLNTTRKPFLKADFTSKTDKIELSSTSKLENGYFYYIAQKGFDKVPPKKTSNNLEITRQYLNKKGEELKNVVIGDEVIVKIKYRVLDKDNYRLIAITDLLPGGFEVLRDSVVADSIEYYDIREDRVLFYTYGTGDIYEISYRGRILASGEFTIPPMYAEAMYDRKINANTEIGRLIVSGTDIKDK